MSRLLDRTIRFTSLSFVMTLLAVTGALAAVPPELTNHDVATYTVVSGGENGGLPSTATTEVTIHLVSNRWNFLIHMTPASDAEAPGVVRYRSNAGVVEEPIPAGLFYASVPGDAGSSGALHLLQGGVTGVVTLGTGERVWIEPMSRFDAAASANELLAYAESDLDQAYLESLNLFDVEDDDEQAFRFSSAVGEKVDVVAGSQDAARLSLPRGEVVAVDMAIVAEYELYLVLGNDEAAVRDSLAATMSMVNMTYMADLGVATRAARIDIMLDEATDLFDITTTTTATEILNLTREYRSQENHHTDGLGLTAAVIHSSYAEGTTTPSGIIGQAGLGGICRSGGAAWFQAVPFASEFVRVALWAHEFGHSLGASHDDSVERCPGELYEPGFQKVCIGGPHDREICGTALDCTEDNDIFLCLPDPDAPDRHIMQSYLNKVEVLEFSECTKLAVAKRLTKSSDTQCLEPVQCGDVNGNGAVTVTDALIALSLAQCTACRLHGLADVAPQPETDQLLSQADAELILDVAVGLEAVPLECGEPSPTCSIQAPTVPLTEKVRLKLTNIEPGGPDDDDRLKLRASGDSLLVNFAAARPDLYGAQMKMVAVDGTAIIDVALPPGVYAGSGTVGWRQSGGGQVWRYKDRTGDPVGGISKLSAKATAKNGGTRVKLGLKGRGGDYATLANELPVDIMVQLGDIAIAQGLCADTNFSADDCATRSNGTRIQCSN